MKRVEGETNLEFALGEAIPFVIIAALIILFFSNI